MRVGDKVRHKFTNREMIVIEVNPSYGSNYSYLVHCRYYVKRYLMAFDWELADDWFKEEELELAVAMTI